MVNKLAFLAVMCALLGAFILVAPAAAADPIPLIIDTDMALDDWMATLYVLNNPDFSVKAITVTGTGFATCDAGVQAALGLLALAEYGDVPVSCWRNTPLVGENPVPTEWLTNMERVEALGLPEGGEPADEDAVSLFTSTLEASSGKITVLALGPLTNVGAALEANPDLVDKIEMMYVMGGAVDVPGSPVSEENTTAEWNIYCDPHAARLVFESGAPITLIPLDATNEAPVSKDFVERLASAQQTPEAQFVHGLLTFITDAPESVDYYFWDPLAAAVMADPSLVTLQTRDVTVIDTPGAENGRTKPVGNGSEIQVATAPDIETFEQRLIDTWNS